MKRKLALALGIGLFWVGCAAMVYSRTPPKRQYADYRPWTCTSVPPTADERPQLAVERQVCFLIDVDLGLKVP